MPAVDFLAQVEWKVELTVSSQGSGSRFFLDGGNAKDGRLLDTDEERNPAIHDSRILNPYPPTILAGQMGFVMAGRWQCFSRVENYFTLISL